MVVETMSVLMIVTVKSVIVKMKTKEVKGTFEEKYLYFFVKKEPCEIFHTALCLFCADCVFVMIQVFIRVSPSCCVL